MPQGEQAKRYYVSGRVQGVGYRFFALKTARQLGLAGYARNLPDGRVEVYAVGTGTQLGELAKALRRGPRTAAVTEVSEVDAELNLEFAGDFYIE